MKNKILVFSLCAVLSGPVFAETAAYTASGDNEIAVDISGDMEMTLSGTTISKTDGDADNGDEASFYGINSAIRVYDNGSLTLSDSVILSDAPNATGVFVYGNGTACLSDCEVTVTGSGSGGIQVAGGGILTGENLVVTSDSKAAIRSDRGGGIMILDGGTYISKGKNGCPAIYSTADITVKNARCISEQSRAVIIEGKNSVTLENVVLEGNDQSSKAGSVHANVLLYQSTSGDADEGTAVFSMSEGSITSDSGAMFYCTNTDSIINLEDVMLSLSDDGTLLIVSEGRWGKEGKNGGDCFLNADTQELDGMILVDEISSLVLNLKDSSYIGVINGEGNGGTVTVTLDENSSWTLTGDSYITEFEGNIEQIESNGFQLYIDGEAVFPAQ